MKILFFPSWNWSWSMLTERRRCRTPWRSSPLHWGQVSLVKMAYLQNMSPSEHLKQQLVLPVLDIWPVQELVEDSSVGVSSPTDSDVLSQAQILHLVSNSALLPVPGLFGLVGFNAADVMGGALHQGLDQTVGLFLNRKEWTCWTCPQLITVNTRWNGSMFSLKISFLGLPHISYIFHYLSHLDLTACSGWSSSFFCLQVLREQSSDEWTDHKHFFFYRETNYLISV